MRHRTSWYLQQILKMYAHRLLPSLGDHLLLDADVIFERPVDLVARMADGLVTYNYETAQLLPHERNYYRTIDCLLQGRVRRLEARSAVVDMMVLSLRVVRSLVALVEAIHRAPLWLAIMRCVQSLQASATQSDFSEYSLYFTYARQFHPATMRITSQQRASWRAHHAWALGRLAPAVG